MARFICWLDSWRGFVRAVWLARRKKHGAGPQPWRYAIATGNAMRFIIYGQNYNRNPRNDR